MDNEAIPQRNTGVRTSLPTVAKPSTNDERDFSTLQAVHKTLADAVNELSKDFNAFAILKEDMPADAAVKLLHDVEVKQGIYDIIYPLFLDIDGTIEQINASHRSK